MLVAEHGMRAFNSVHSGGNYAAGIARTLAAGINSADFALAKFIAQNSHGA